VARPPRLQYPNAIYHVSARGNERAAIYRDEGDRRHFLELLADAVKHERWRVLSYCLMTNHYHLLVETPNANLARGMRHLNGVYAQAFHRHYGRDGHLFQGRYGAILVQRDEHLLGAVRYILRNPLRAGMCERVDEWPWSSHAATVGARPPGFLALEALLAYFGESRARARARYLDLVASDGAGIVAHPLIDGDERFVASSLEELAVSVEHPRAHVRPLRPPLAELVTDSPDASAIVRAHREHAYSMRQIATHLGCGVTTIHRRIRGWEEGAHDRESSITPKPPGSGVPRRTAPPSGTWKT
jgi:REP element-mobilizing transposase RayT